MSVWGGTRRRTPDQREWAAFLSSWYSSCCSSHRRLSHWETFSRRHKLSHFGFSFSSNVEGLASICQRRTWPTLWSTSSPLRSKLQGLRYTTANGLPLTDLRSTKSWISKLVDGWHPHITASFAFLPSASSSESRKAWKSNSTQLATSIRNGSK